MYISNTRLVVCVCVLRRSRFSYVSYIIAHWPCYTQISASKSSLNEDVGRTDTRGDSKDDVYYTLLTYRSRTVKDVIPFAQVGSHLFHVFLPEKSILYRIIYIKHVSMAFMVMSGSIDYVVCLFVWRKRNTALLYVSWPIMCFIRCGDGKSMLKLSLLSCSIHSSFRPRLWCWRRDLRRNISRTASKNMLIWESCM